MPSSPVRAVSAHNTTRDATRITAAVKLLALSPIEEDFFRAGESLSEPHDFSDLDEGRRPMTLWRAFLSWLRGERTASTD